MKSIYLIRHSKSSWDTHGKSDFDRTLTEEGHQIAEHMATFLKNQDIKPDLLLSSPAIRTLTTCKYFATAFDITQTSIKTVLSLYNATRQDLMEAIQSIDNQFNTVLLICHNPSVSDVLDLFVADFVPEVTTCGIANFTLNSNSWRDFNVNKAEFKALWEPQNILTI
jgi:phosphohistidine phosphatase